MILGALLQHHSPPPTAETPVDLDTLNVQTLAGLSSAQAQAVVAARGVEVQPYYEFVAGLLYATLNAHLHDAVVVSTAIRLALLLTAESIALPVACERFARLLTQAAGLRNNDHPAGLQLLAELEGSGHALLSAVLLREPMALVAVGGMWDCCAELMRAAPPSDEWRRGAASELDRQARAVPSGAADLTKAIGLAASLLQPSAEHDEQEPNTQEPNTQEPNTQEPWSQEDRPADDAPSGPP